MDVLCAAVAGAVARLTCHPLDTTKTVAFTGFSGDSHRIHNLKNSFNQSTFRGAARSIWRCEGVTGFYRGVGIATVGSAPGAALYLSTYAAAREFGEQHYYNNSNNNNSNNNNKQSQPHWPLHLLSGFLAEAVSCAVWVPVDVIKERLQSQPPTQPGRYTNSFDAIRIVGRNEGLWGFYKGYWSTLASFGPYSAVYFACFESLNQFFSDHLSFGTFYSALCAGGLGNIMASLVTNPLEFVKTRLQVQRAILLVNGKPTPVCGFHYHYKGLFHGIYIISKEEGIWALWRGVGCRAAYAAPNAALTMAFYKYLQSTWV